MSARRLSSRGLRSTRFRSMRPPRSRQAGPVRDLGCGLFRVGPGQPRSPTNETRTTWAVPSRMLCATTLVGRSHDGAMGGRACSPGDLHGSPPGAGRLGVRRSQPGPSSRRSRHTDLPATRSVTGAEQGLTRGPMPGRPSLLDAPAFGGRADRDENAAGVGDGQGVEQREDTPGDAVGVGDRPGSQERRSSLCRVAGLGG